MNEKEIETRIYIMVSIAFGLFFLLMFYILVSTISNEISRNDFCKNEGGYYGNNVCTIKGLQYELIPKNYFSPFPKDFVLSRKYYVVDIGGQAE